MEMENSKNNRFYALCAVAVWCGAILVVTGLILTDHDKYVNDILLSATGITGALFALINARAAFHPSGTPAEPLSVTASQNNPVATIDTPTQNDAEQTQQSVAKENPTDAP